MSSQSMHRMRRQPELNDSQGIADILLTILKWVVIVVVMLFFISWSDKAYQLGYDVLSEQAVDAKGEGKTVSVKITSDMSVSRVGEVLQEAGLIKDAGVFSLQEKISSYRGRIQPGTYELSTDMTPEEMLEVMAGGVTADETASETVSEDPGEAVS